MIVEDDIAHRLDTIALPYRTLWLNDAAALGQIAECLSEALNWQPSDDAPLPDALALAEAAAERIRRSAPEYA